MDKVKALRDIEMFLLEGGELALEKQKSVKKHYKAGEEAVTETDLAISELAQKRLVHWFDKDDHLLLDEESIDQVGTPEDAFNASSYHWALDPIDGTAGYAMGRFLWGISLGVMHQGYPVLGGIYLPAIQEMILADGIMTWRIQDPGTKNAIKTRCFCEPIDINSQTYVESFYGYGHGWGEDHKSRGIWMNTPESAVQGFLSPLVGQSAGIVIARSYSLWDSIAGCAAALQAGFSVRSMSSGRALERFCADDFEENWKMKDRWLICAPENFGAIHAALTRQD